MHQKLYKFYSWQVLFCSRFQNKFRLRNRSLASRKEFKKCFLCLKSFFCSDLIISIKKNEQNNRGDEIAQKILSNVSTNSQVQAGISTSFARVDPPKVLFAVDGVIKIRKAVFLKKTSLNPSTAPEKWIKIEKNFFLQIRFGLLVYIFHAKNYCTR